MSKLYCVTCKKEITDLDQSFGHDRYHRGCSPYPDCECMDDDCDCDVCCDDDGCGALDNWCKECKACNCCCEHAGDREE